MKYDDVRAALVGVYPDAEVAMDNLRMPLHRVIGYAIVDLWINKTPDDKNTETLRAAMQHLDNGGFLE